MINFLPLKASTTSSNSSGWGCKNKKLINHSQLFFISYSYSLIHYCYCSL